jgi:hypothetical protein
MRKVNGSRICGDDHKDGSNGHGLPCAGTKAWTRTWTKYCTFSQEEGKLRSGLLFTIQTVADKLSCVRAVATSNYGISFFGQNIGEGRGHQGLRYGSQCCTILTAKMY